MSMVVPTEIISIAVFILPGYLLIYMVNIFTDYITEKDTLERIMHYLIFSTICYATSFATLVVALLVIDYINISAVAIKWDIPMLNFVSEYLMIILTLSFIYALIFGFLLGNYYFKRGYPYKHFRKYTNKRYFPSIYADLINEYRRGAWITFHMKDSTVIQGKLIRTDRDEDKRDYVLAVKDAMRYYPKLKTKKQLRGEKIAINLKDTNLIEFNR